MKKYSFFYSFLLITALFFSGCFKTEHDRQTHIKFGVSADYPPFEFYQNGEIVGFDIELAQLVAQKLGKIALFEDLPFESILAALSNKDIDAAISTLTITKERQKTHDYSIPYFKQTLALVYDKASPFKNIKQLDDKKIGAQLGSAQQLWLSKHNPQAELVTMNNNYQLIEALKAGQINAVIIDQSQATAFCKKNDMLSFFTIQNSSEPYGIMLEKKSPLTQQINDALRDLEEEGKINELIQKWLTTTEG